MEKGRAEIGERLIPVLIILAVGDGKIIEAKLWRHGKATGRDRGAPFRLSSFCRQNGKMIVAKLWRYGKGTGRDRGAAHSCSHHFGLIILLFPLLLGRATTY